MPDFHSQAYRRGVDGWTEVPVPDIGRLSGSAVVSREDAWAVGQPVKYGQGASVHWDGRTWTRVPLAPSPPRHRLHVEEMAAFDSDDVWVVGNLTSDDPAVEGRGVVQHWNGTKWTDVVVPDVPGAWSLSGVGGITSNDLWAVGEVAGAPGQGVALHWDGRRWSEVAVPEIEGSAMYDVKLTDVAALASDDVWATGTWYSYGDEESQPILMHWDGRAWTLSETPVETGGLGDLVRVGDQLWSVGSTVLHYDGATWRRVKGPSAVVPTAGTVLGSGRLLTVGSAGPGNKKQPFVSVHHGRPATGRR